jgi:site-specific recombinase XerD
MMDSFCLPPYTIPGMNAGPLGPFLARYVGFLQQRRYTPDTIRCSLYAACAFGRWLEEQERITLSQVSEKVITKYRDPFRRKNIKPSLPTEVTGLPKLLTWLREQGLVPPSGRPSHTDQEKWLSRYDDYLASVHGISVSTRSKYIACAARFIGNLFGNSVLDWSAVTADRIRQFVAIDIHDHHAEQTVCALRAALRFLIAESCIPAHLLGAAPSLPRYRPAGIPCHLSEDEVQRVISVCHDKTALGLRDQAMITLLARMGLRASEVARLGLDDIDWTDGRLIIRAGKTKRERALPLPDDIGHCIVRYLKRARPSSNHRSLFVRHRAPFTPLSPFTISWIAGSRLKQAGIPAARFGSHVFRHSAATQMVRRGASFKDIADILGHQRLETTRIYAKLDLGTLLQVALPWPGGER